MPFSPTPRPRRRKDTAMHIKSVSVAASHVQQKMGPHTRENIHATEVDIRHFWTWPDMQAAVSKMRDYLLARMPKATAEPFDKGMSLPKNKAKKGAAALRHALFVLEEISRLRGKDKLPKAVILYYFVIGCRHAMVIPYPEDQVPYFAANAMHHAQKASGFEGTRVYFGDKPGYLDSSTWARAHLTIAQGIAWYLGMATLAKIEEVNTQSEA